VLVTGTDEEQNDVMGQEGYRRDDPEEKKELLAGKMEGTAVVVLIDDDAEL
jgi:hypothetical protein